MKKYFKVELTCPYCKKKFFYNILSFKAKCVCPHCENDLLVHTRMKVAIPISILGFVLLIFVNSFLQIYRFGQIVDLLYWIIGCLVFVAIAYKVLCSTMGPEKVYLVDMEDPTILERKRESKNK